MGHFSTDATLIVQFTPDGIIESGTAGVVAKMAHQNKGSRVVTIRSPGGDSAWWERAELLAKCRLLPDKFRLMLRGHGDWASQSLGGWSALQIAHLLRDARLPKPEIVTVTGCSLGRDRPWAQDSGNQVVGHCVSSFGSHLHKYLSVSCGHRVDLYARVRNVAVYGPALTDDANWLGRKVTFAAKDGPALHAQPHSKLHFYWQGSQQARKWADDDSRADADDHKYVWNQH